MSNKLVIVNCMVCSKEFLSEEPQMCCSGKDCGCMGMPIDPIICSSHCYHSLPFLKDKYLVWIETSKQLPNEYNLHSHIEVIIRYEKEIVGFDEKPKEIICSAFYNTMKGFYLVDDPDLLINNVTHFMYMPKSPMLL